MARIRHTIEGEARFEMRSEPRQRRARSTVAAIKQATLELLAREGLASCTTNRIAEHAGIGVGSLYQYFPNREAILKALYEDVSLDFARAMQNLTLKILDLPIEQAVTRVMRELVVMHERNQLILLQLVDEVPQLKLETQPISFSNLVLSSIRAFVQHRNPALTSREVGYKAFFLERIILSSIQRYLHQPPAGMSRRYFTRNLAHIVASFIEDKG